MTHSLIPYFPNARLIAERPSGWRVTTRAFAAVFIDWVRSRLFKQELNCFQKIHPPK
jgi:hypothetical protein